MRNDLARRRELCEFLKFARSRVSPNAISAARNERRRVPGLRRDEVANMCGVSVAWYTWFETGRPNTKPSPKFVAAVANSLRLEPQETTYLFSLAIPEMPRIESPVLGTVRATIDQLASSADGRRLSVEELAVSCDAFPIGVHWTTPAGRMLYANRAQMRLLGYSSQREFLALDVARDVYERSTDYDTFKARIGKSGRLMNVPTRLRCADDSLLVVSASATIIADADGSIGGYLGTWEAVQ